ncbi:hypothetical protein AKO1_014765 [Acrasis kona]|uniref:Uncharacterized protein n=1 Tax=Acrasis kona TaxID=1008807 RepID=A0AAW2Z3D0_9EUKA
MDPISSDQSLRQSEQTKQLLISTTIKESRNPNALVHQFFTKHKSNQPGFNFELIKSIFLLLAELPNSNASSVYELGSNLMQSRDHDEKEKIEIATRLVRFAEVKRDATNFLKFINMLFIMSPSPALYEKIKRVMGSDNSWRESLMKKVMASNPSVETLKSVIECMHIESRFKEAHSLIKKQERNVQVFKSLLIHEIQSLGKRKVDPSIVASTVVDDVIKMIKDEDVFNGKEHVNITLIDAYYRAGYSSILVEALAEKVTRLNVILTANQSYYLRFVSYLQVVVKVFQQSNLVANGSWKTLIDSIMDKHRNKPSFISKINSSRDLFPPGWNVMMRQQQPPQRPPPVVAQRTTTMIQPPNINQQRLQAPSQHQLQQTFRVAPKKK